MTNVGFFDNLNPNVFNHFVVKNTSNDYRTIKIFQIPIPYGQSYNLITVPGVSEADIVESLMKGELNIKIKQEELVITHSDLNMLQFNMDQKAFLQAAGVDLGLSIGTAQLDPDIDIGGSLPIDFHQNIQLMGAKNSVNRMFSTPHVFINGEFKGSDFTIIVKHNGRIMEPETDYEVMESTLGDGYDTVRLLSVIPNEYSSLLADYVSERLL